MKIDWNHRWKEARLGGSHVNTIRWRWLTVILGLTALTAVFIVLTPPATVPTEQIREFEHVIAYIGGWQVQVEYQPNDPYARVSVRMDGMSRWQDVEVRVESSTPWAPTWSFRLQGQFSEFVTLKDGVKTATPMTADVAGQLALSYRVTLEGHGTKQVMDFSKSAGFAVPAPPDPTVRYRLVVPPSAKTINEPAPPMQQP